MTRWARIELAVASMLLVNACASVEPQRWQVKVGFADGTFRR